MSNLEVLQRSSLVVIDVGHILDINIEHQVEVLLDECKINWVRPDDRRGTVLGDWIDSVSQICEVQISQRINLLTIDLNSTVVRIGVHIRVLLLHDNSKLIGISLIPNRIGSERQGVGDVIE